MEVFCGVRISATGQMIKRNDYQPSRQVSDEEWQQRLTLLQRSVTELSKFTFETQPHLQIKFSGDLADLENARVTGSLRAEGFRRGPYEWRGLRLAGEFADQTLSLTQCDWQDDFGLLKASGIWHRANEQIQFQARSSLNLRELLGAFGVGSILNDFVFLTSPHLEISGEARLGDGQPRWQSIGRVAFEHFTYKGIPFNGASAEFSWDGERACCTGYSICRHQSGELSAQLLDAPDDFRLD